MYVVFLRENFHNFASLTTLGFNLAKKVGKRRKRKNFSLDEKFLQKIGIKIFFKKFLKINFSSAKIFFKNLGKIIFSSAEIFSKNFGKINFSSAKNFL